MPEPDKPRDYNIIHSVLVAIIIIIAAIWGEKVWDKKSIEGFEKAASIENGAQFASIYEDFWNQVNQNYYRKNLDGIDWNAQKTIGLEKAKQAKTRDELFTEIIQKQIDLFPVSHLTILPNPGQSNNGEKVSFTDDELAFNHSLAGIGIISIKRGTKRLNIINYVIPNSPANNANIKAGYWVRDYKIIFDDKTPSALKITISPIIIENLQPILNETGEIIGFRDKDGGEISFSSLETKEFEFNLAPPPKFEIKNNEIIQGVSYIRLDSFMDEIEITSFIELVKTCPKDGFVIDLRNNLGGDLELFQRAISVFLPPHTLLMHTKTRSWSRTFHSSWFYKECEAPLIVLIGPKSASAAEVFASSLQFYRRAKIMGRSSNGSVIGARDFVVLDGSLLQIPMIELLGPDKKSLEGIGVRPDIELISDFETEPSKDKLVLQAISELKAMN